MIILKNINVLLGLNAGDQVSLGKTDRFQHPKLLEGDVRSWGHKLI